MEKQALPKKSKVTYTPTADEMKVMSVNPKWTPIKRIIRFCIIFVVLAFCGLINIIPGGAIVGIIIGLVAAITVEAIVYVVHPHYYISADNNQSIIINNLHGEEAFIYKTGEVVNVTLHSGYINESIYLETGSANYRFIVKRRDRKDFHDKKCEAKNQIKKLLESREAGEAKLHSEINSEANLKRVNEAKEKLVKLEADYKLNREKEMVEFNAKLKIVDAESDKEIAEFKDKNKDLLVADKKGYQIKLSALTVKPAVGSLRVLHKNKLIDESFKHQMSRNELKRLSNPKCLLIEYKNETKAMVKEIKYDFDGYKKNRDSSIEFIDGTKTLLDLK